MTGVCPTCGRRVRTAGLYVIRIRAHGPRHARCTGTGKTPKPGTIEVASPD